jgi:transposase
MSDELHTFITALLPSSCAVRLSEVTVAQEYVLIQLTAMAPTPCCPRCATLSSSVHSRYQRQPADLPWGSLAVRIQLTVRKFVSRTPSCARRIFTERLPDLTYLIRRWRESRADRFQLWREIQALGYTHSARTVCRFIIRRRRVADAGYPPEPQGSPCTCPQGPSARAVSCAMVCPAAKRSRDAQTYVDQLCQMDACIARVHALSQAFLVLVRERQGDSLEAWTAEATHNSGIAELARFAWGLQDDLSAVTARLTLEWSNGVTEGQINRLKLLKRQSYGRVVFALIRLAFGTVVRASLVGLGRDVNAIIAWTRR